MTKNELAKLEAKKVRSDTNLFALFKKYVTEDAGLLYSSGKLPAGCFGCQFNSFFNRWRNLYLTQKKRTKMANSKKTYELKKKTTRIYFKGSVLSDKSSDEAWLGWINRPADSAKVAERKAYFSKLPQSGSEDVAEAPKKPKRAAKKSPKQEDVEQPETETETETEETPKGV